MWQDWTNVVFGIWMAVSPWLLGLNIPEQPNIMYNCVLSGVLIASFAAGAAYAPKEIWQEWVVAFLGIWLLMAPASLSYASNAAIWNDVIVGLIVVILAFWRIHAETEKHA